MYSNEIKNEAMTEIKNGKTIKEVSEEMRISKPTIYKWLKEVNKENTSKELEDKKDEINQECKEISKQIKQLIADLKYEEAKELGKRFKYDVPIQSHEEDNKKSKYLSEIKTKIYCDKIDDNIIKEINESKILSEYEKTIILLAICEKNNMIKRAKQIISKANIEDKKQKSKINQIMERINSKKKKYLI